MAPFRSTIFRLAGYTIQARKPGFKNNSVSIAVRAEDVTTARIFLEPVEEEEEDPPARGDCDQRRSDLVV